MEQHDSVSVFPAVGRVALRQLTDLDRVSNLSEEMLSRVAIGDIEELLVIQGKRAKLLYSCLNPPIEGELAEATKIKIQELLLQNEAILEQVNAAKVRLISEMQEMQNSHRAASLYLQSAI